MKMENGFGMMRGQPVNAKEIEDLLGKVTQGEWGVTPPENEYLTTATRGNLGEIYADGRTVCSFGYGEDESHYNACGEPPSVHDATLIALAPSLARRVVAAEKLVEALDQHLQKGDSIMDADEKIIDHLIAAYREASK